MIDRLPDWLALALCALFWHPIAWDVPLTRSHDLPPGDWWEWSDLARREALR